MRGVRSWVVLASSLVGVVYAAFVAWSIVASRPEPTGQHRPPAGLDAATLDAHAGLYRDGNGGSVLLAPSAGGGLALFAADDFAFTPGRDLGRATVHGGRWQLASPDGTQAQALEFQRADGQIIGMRVGSGGTQRAWTRDAHATYAVRAVEFGGDPRLSGTLFLPRAASPVPGAVLIHGSGSSDRDGLWYVLVARTLAGQGIAVLLPDKRGSGRSGGEWRTASFADLAGDALAAVRVLAQQPGVDPAKVGLVGMSQGGWVAPLAAADARDVAFVANLVGAAVTPAHQTRHEIAQQLRDSGVPRWLVPALMPVVARMPARRLPEWWRLNGQFDPLPLWRRLPQRALVVYGAEDERDNVPVAESVARLRSLGLPPSKLRVETLPGVGHGLLQADTRELHPQVRAWLVEWILGDP